MARRWTIAPLVAAALAALVAAASPGEVGAADPPAGATRDETSVEGSLPPALFGRWLVAMDAKASIGGQPVSTPGAVMLRTFEVVEVEGRPELRLHRGSLPDDWKARIDERAVPQGKRTSAELDSAKGAAPPAGKRPDDEAMAAVANLWPGMLALDTDARIVSSRIGPYASASAVERERMNAEGAQLLVVLDEDFPKGDTQSRQSVTALAIEKLSPDRLEGRFVQAIRVSPLEPGDFTTPAHVGMEGAFVAYRVPGEEPAGTPSKGIAASFLDLFSGCGSR